MIMLRVAGCKRIFTPVHVIQLDLYSIRLSPTSNTLVAYIHNSTLYFVDRARKQAGFAPTELSNNTATTQRAQAQRTDNLQVH
jgi:hypothetical protein